MPVMAEALRMVQFREEMDGLLMLMMVKVITIMVMKAAQMMVHGLQAVNQQHSVDFSMIIINCITMEQIS